MSKVALTAWLLPEQLRLPICFCAYRKRAFTWQVLVELLHFLQVYLDEVSDIAEDRSPLVERDARAIIIHEYVEVNGFTKRFHHISEQARKYGELTGRSTLRLGQRPKMRH